MEYQKKGRSFFWISIYRFYVWFILFLLVVPPQTVVYAQGSTATIFPLVALLFLVCCSLGKLPVGFHHIAFVIFGTIFCGERLLQYFPRPLLPKLPFYAILAGNIVLAIGFWSALRRSLSRTTAFFWGITSCTIIAASTILFTMNLFPYIRFDASILLVFFALLLTGVIWSIRAWFLQARSLRKQSLSQFTLYLLC